MLDLRVDRLAEVLDHAVAPAFVLGSVAAFLAILLTRIENLMGRMRLLLAHQQGDPAAWPEHDAALLERRLGLLHRAVLVALCAGIAGAMLVLIAFLCGFLGLDHEYGMGGLFVVTLGLLGLALGLFAKEAWIALRDFERSR